MNNYHKEFEKMIKHVSYSRGTYEIFSDFLILSACSLYNSIHHDKDVENTYQTVADRYKPEELTKMSKLLALLVEALTASQDDFLGVVYQELELANSHGGQFFTPDSLSQLIAQLLFHDSERQAGRVTLINEPACGSGGMIMASFNQLSDEDKEWTHIVAQDVDIKCFYMTYIQLFLLGASAEVVLGNTLKMECRKVWRTFGYYALDMENKRKIDHFLTLCEEGSFLPGFNLRGNSLISL